MLGPFPNVRTILPHPHHLKHRPLFSPLHPFCLLSQVPNYGQKTGCLDPEEAGGEDPPVLGQDPVSASLVGLRITSLVLLALPVK